MSRISFGDSFRPKGSFTVIAQKKLLESNGFKESARKKGSFKKDADKLRPEISFLNDDVKKSNKLHDYYFTNFISSKTEQSIKTCIYDIYSDPNVVDTPNASEVTINKKIQECLKLYLPQVPVGALIIKSNLIDGLGAPKPFRVFSIMEFQHNPPKAISKIVLIDPFHLVIPSQHNGKQKRTVESEVYKSNMNNHICMYDYFKEQAH
ncbi:hypothetical protein [Paenibacillus woosongensis]|uniref:Uncharacterized protein n=1 Tax=Paenibacillus woosongensis TaxID=307580 RepID=A0ABQ4MXF0_9BACL|nr:hypothetical protein [Paenibacillus woosongensis]GIP60598.1 hypothetical protein J15TS10_44120 [Paenibacillus woosongensis]